MKRLFTAIACFSVMGLPQYSFSEQRMIEEIIVTATKREESIHDVPIAISAFSGRDLQSRGITEVDDLMQVAPSFFVNTSNSTSNGGTMRIRGIGTTGNNVGLEAAVGFFADGVYRSRSGQGLQSLLDIERVEILRGPQGTLFGKNTSAGAVHVITNKPIFETEGSISVSGGSYDHVALEGIFNTPLIEDVLALRVAASYQKRDGYYDDIDTSDAYSNRDRYMLKGQLLWTPSDAFEARLILDYADKDETCCPATYEILGPTAAILQAMGGTPIVSARGDVGVNHKPFETIEDFGVTLQLSWDLDWATLESVTGVRDFESARGQDVDFSNVDLYTVGNNIEKFETFSQELRLVGASESIDWLVGFFYSDEDIDSRGIDTDRGTNFLVLGEEGPLYFDLLLGPLFGLPAGVIEGLLSPGDGLAGSYTQKAKSWSLFTHNVWHATDRLDLTLGARYTEEDKDGSTRINGETEPGVAGEVWPCATLPIPTFCSNAGYDKSRSEEKFTGTVKIAYALGDDHNLYAGFARGYKAGGFNLDPTALKVDATGAITSDGSEFEEEVADTFEVGLKSEWMDRRLTTNFAAFSSTFDDFQLNTFTGAFFVVDNVPEVSSKGLEFEYSLSLMDGVFLQGGLTWTNTEYSKVLEGQDNLDDKRLTNAPEWQGSQGLMVDRPFFGGGLNYVLSLNYFFIGEHNTGSDLDAEKLQGSYGIWNGQFGVRTADTRYEGYFWMRNMFDKEYDQVIFDSVSQAGSWSTFVGAPRMWGVTLKANL